MIRILIVEDQAILRESLARSVGDQPDMTVVAAIADASDALDVALKEHPDMILMDVCTEHDSNGMMAAAHQRAAARVPRHYHDGHARDYVCGSGARGRRRQLCVQERRHR
ncbi:MAG: response regulator transcription factor [Collinsella sp.]